MDDENKALYSLWHIIDDSSKSRKIKDSIKMSIKNTIGNQTVEKIKQIKNIINS